MKKIISVLLILSLILGFVGCQSQNNNNDDIPPVSQKPDPPAYTASEVLTKDDFISDIYTDSDGKNLPFRIYLPENYNSDYAYPLLVFLHGAGERGDDNDLQLKNVVMKLFEDKSSPIYQCILIAPQCPVEEQWVDTPWEDGNYSVDQIPESDQLRQVMELIDMMKEDYSVNDKRIYAMGLSMGGFGTWDLAMRHPEVFAAIVPICGGADPDKAERLKDIPVFTFHGDVDSTVPVTGTRDMVAALERAGNTKVTYQECAGWGHNVWDVAAADPDLIYSLFAIRK